MVEQNAGRPNPIEGNRPEVTRMQVVQKAELLMPGSFFNETDELDLQGRTVEEIAGEVSPSVFGIRTFRRVEGEVMVDGKPVRVSSGNLDYSGTTYIGGQVLTLDEVKRTVPDSRTLVSNMEGNGWDKVIRTRAGNFQPFEANDRVIPEPQPKARRTR